GHCASFAESASSRIYPFGDDPVRRPVSTFRDHALSPYPVELVRKDHLDLVAVVQRGAGVGDDDLAFLDALADLDVAIREKADLNLARFDDVVLDHLHGR